MTCNKPDRDVAKLRCGYPLPCPWHTITVKLGNPPVISEPSTSELSQRGRRRLKRITDILAKKGQR